MVIPGHREHAPITRRAERVGVFDHVHAAVDARAFAVPHAKNTIEARTFEQIGLLASPYRCSGKVLINARLEVNLMSVEIR